MSLSVNRPCIQSSRGGAVQSQPQPHRQPSATAATMTFKEEPLDEDANVEPRRLVIDLTPDAASSQPGRAALRVQGGARGYSVTGDGRPTGKHPDMKGSYPGQNSRYHPYPRSAHSGGHPSQAGRVSDGFCPSDEAATLLLPAVGGDGGGSGGLRISNGFGGDSGTRPSDEAAARAARDAASLLAGNFAHHFASLSDSASSVGLECDPGSGSGSGIQPRAKREFVPDHKKDGQYWNKRHKNNLSARRSRVKRKNLERRMESEMFDLQAENRELRLELEKLQKMFGLPVGSKDLTSSPARSPGSSSTISSSSSLSSSSSSSGIGTSNSSSGGSAEHSTSSSPVLGADEEKPKSKPAGFQAMKDSHGGSLLHAKNLERQLYNAACGVSVVPSCSIEHPASSAGASMSGAVFPPTTDTLSTLDYTPGGSHAIPPATLSHAQTAPPPAHFNNVSRKVPQPDSDCHSLRRNSPPAAHSAHGGGASSFAKNYSSPSSLHSASTHEPFALYAGGSFRHISKPDHNIPILSIPKNAVDDGSPSLSSPSSRYARAAVNSNPAPCTAISRGSNLTTICTSATNFTNYPSLTAFNHFVTADGPVRAPHRQSLSSEASSDGSCSSYFQPDFIADASDLRDHVDLRERYSFSSRNNSPDEQESGCESAGTVSQGGSPGQVSEDDNASSGSGESRRSSRSSTEDPVCLHKIPLKCRMKRELHSAFSTSSLRSVK